jgi:hypothetical protein
MDLMRCHVDVIAEPQNTVDTKMENSQPACHSQQTAGKL